MKKLKYLVVLLLAILILPFSVFAEDEGESSSESNEAKEVNVYFFRGEGCSHCAEAEEWFNSIEEEYGNYFNIVDYETWYDSDNAALMEKVAETRNETADGVPYIIIGNKSWNGFADDYKDEILEQIKSVYEQDVTDRYDIMEYISSGTSTSSESDKSNGSDVVALLLILIIFGGIGFGIYKARKSTN